MGRSATMSPLGLYTWDNSLFDLMEIPEGLDKTVLVQNILYETAELEVLYPNPVVFKNLLAVWSRKQLPVWQKLYDTTQFEYNPIENYDRMETGTDTGTGTTTHGGADGRTETLTTGGRDTESTTQAITNGGSDTVTGNDVKGHWIAGYDSTASGQSDGLVKQTRDEDDASTTTQYGKTENGTGSSTTNYGKTESVSESKTYGETVRNTSDGEHTLRAHGNIGVTTTQEMIEQERKIDLFNMYDIIIEDFKMRFCILIY